MTNNYSEHIRQSLAQLAEIITLMLSIIGHITLAITAGADITDFTSDFSRLDNAVFRACNILAQAHVFDARISDPIREMVIVVDQPNLLVLHTPYLHKRKYSTFDGHCVVSPLIQHALSCSPLKMRDQVAEIAVDILSIYPQNTRSYTMADPDNISAKRIIDLATMALGVDDNGAITTLTIDAIRSDLLPPGTYTVIRPRSSRFDDDHPILILIKEGIRC